MGDMRSICADIVHCADQYFGGVIGGPPRQQLQESWWHSSTCQRETASREPRVLKVVPKFFELNMGNVQCTVVHHAARVYIQVDANALGWKEETEILQQEVQLYTDF